MLFSILPTLQAHLPTVYFDPLKSKTQSIFAVGVWSVTFFLDLLVSFPRLLEVCNFHSGKSLWLKSISYPRSK
ncbi:hypothetical protein ANCCAN_23588 [Ancylostoma caninum]|uniref:Uncharacterized protein n=1 Tax=Ancylostoma caninum TaxID=29170 RepID=A0A368FKE5_ANCCA|nr:hypothetical protein ANCCAN_23588 [Ancylostoma caninum]